MALLAASLVGIGVLLASLPENRRGSLARLGVPEKKGWVPSEWAALEERVGMMMAGLLSRIACTGWGEGTLPPGRVVARRLGRGGLSGTLGAVAAAVTGRLLGIPASPQLMLAAAVAAAALPFWWEERSRGRMVREIATELPQFLELLVVCHEAGLNLRESLERVARAAGGRLGGEIHTLLDTVGPAQLVVELGRKYGVPELRALGGALRQGELLGLPMVEVFRSQAQALREASRRRVRAMSATAPVKLSVCTVCLFLPATLALVLVPQLLVFLSRW